MHLRPITIRVLLQDSAEIKKLTLERDTAQNRANDFQEQLKRARNDMADVQRVNLELIDTLKSYGYKFRPNADVRTWGR